MVNSGFRVGLINGIAALAVLGLSACTPSKNYSNDLKPLQVVNYVTETNRVLKRQAYFGDDHSNVIALTDMAADGFLPNDDADGLVDQVGLEIYQRNLVLDFFIRDGDVYQGFLAAQAEKNYSAMDRRVVEVLTEKFVKQTNYLWTASSKAQYEIALRTIDVAGAQVGIAVDGQEGRVENGAMRRINGVYVMLVEIEGIGDTATDFAVLQIGNQRILLKSAQSVRVGIEATIAPDSKISRREKINYVFVVPNDTAPGPNECVLEDIFHTLMVADRPDHGHVSYYRMVRERGKPDFLASQGAAGFRVTGDQFEETQKGGFVNGVTEQITDRINDGLDEFLALFGGQKKQPVALQVDDADKQSARSWWWPLGKKSKKAEKEKKEWRPENADSVNRTLSFTEGSR